MIVSTRERWRELAGLEGLISEQTGYRLAQLAAAVPVDQLIVEVGSFKGKSTAYLAEGSSLGNNVKVIAVDPWDLQPDPGKHDYNNPDTRKAWESQLKKVGLRSLVTARKAYSLDAAKKFKDGEIGLLYIDGDHEYDSVKSDFEAWSPHLSANGIVVFDDYATRNKGVTQFVNELTYTRKWSADLKTLPLAILTPR